MRSARKSPQVMVLLDMLMLWILALLAVPAEKTGIRYEFLGVPPGGVVFEVELPIDTSQREWRSFDDATGAWVSGRTPFGRENFMCAECMKFLPETARPAGELMLSLPKDIRSQLRDAVFKACQVGKCASTLYIDASGRVSTELDAPGLNDER